MKYFLFFIFTVAIQSCFYEDVDSEFLEFIEKGYVKKLNKKSIIFGFNVKRKETCVYGEKPRQVTKETIDSIYSMFVNEFNELMLPVYVSDLMSCPKKTDIYIYVYSTLEDPKNKLISERDNVYGFLNLTMDKEKNSYWSGFNGVGSFSYIKGTNGKIFIEVNQFKDLAKIDPMYNLVVKSLIIEEIYQGVSNGKDLKLPKGDRLLSKLHEPIIEENKLFKQPVYFRKSIIGKNQFKSYFENYAINLKPLGLCTFDIWFLILADKAKDENKYLYQDYVKLYDSTYLKKRASSIENNPEYKKLFDSGCSGENFITNSKVVF